MDILMYLFYPENVKAMDRKRFMSGGCGPSGWKYDLVPDAILGINIQDSCRIHDAMYGLGSDGIGTQGSQGHKSYCDRVFLNNMQRQVEYKKNQWKRIKRLRLWFVYRYYKTVDNHGGPSYWADKNKKCDLGIAGTL